jgi:hypothetical protein
MVVKAESVKPSDVSKSIGTENSATTSSNSANG